jgi:hypothetical protein
VDDVRETVAHDAADRANHFTIAQKDDMALELFLAWLNPMSFKMAEDARQRSRVDEP